MVVLINISNLDIITVVENFGNTWQDFTISVSNKSWLTVIPKVISLIYIFNFPTTFWMLSRVGICNQLTKWLYPWLTSSLPKRLQSLNIVLKSSVTAAWTWRVCSIDLLSIRESRVMSESFVLRILWLRLCDDGWASAYWVLIRDFFHDVMVHEFLDTFQTFIQSILWTSVI